MMMTMMKMWPCPLRAFAYTGAVEFLWETAVYSPVSVVQSGMQQGIWINVFSHGAEYWVTWYFCFLLQIWRGSVLSHVCLSVCLSVCLYCSYFWNPWSGKFCWYAGTSSAYIRWGLCIKVIWSRLQEQKYILGIAYQLMLGRAVCYHWWHVC